MVLPDSHGIPRVPRYSGGGHPPRSVFAYGALTLCGGPFQTLRLTYRDRTSPCRDPRPLLQPPIRNACRLTRIRFRLLRFRSPLLAECILSLFLGVLRCFSSPGSPPCPMCSDMGTAALPAVGFPIRKSPAITLACSLPRLIAACHVLLRLPAPRHPPCALSSLTYFAYFSRS